MVMCIYTAMSFLWARNNESMRKRTSVKQYVNHIEVVIALAKNKTDIIRQVDHNNCNVHSYMITQVKDIFFTIHPDIHLKQLLVKKDGLVPVYTAQSIKKDNIHYEVTAAVGHDGLTCFSHKMFSHRAYQD